MDFELTKEMSVVTILMFGLALGLKHAVEADHLAAVSTIVAERKSIVGSALIGGFWGVGHTLSLLIVGALVIYLKLQISDSVATWLEAVVGVMLIVLGINALRKLRRKKAIHIHTHEHGEHEHTHIHVHETEMEIEGHHLARVTPRSVAIGMVHGLAGSAALMLILVPAISSPAVGLLYIAVFGLGSIGGMMLMSVIISLPMHFTAGRFEKLNTAILLCAGVFSCGLGMFIVYEKLG